MKDTPDAPKTPAQPTVIAAATTTDLTIGLTRKDLDALAWAQRHLEHPSLAARLTSVLGTPIEVGLKLMPDNWYQTLQNTAEQAIEKALDAAISSLRHNPETLMAHDRFHKMLGITSGAVGGFFGPLGLIGELPITTTLMLRAIADIARAEGEDLDTLESRLACLKVFALGGRSEEDDAADTGYYGVRLALSMPIANAAQHIAERGLAEESAPALVKLIAAISSRFSATASQKIAVQAVPLIGAAAGATVNVVFMQHFQDMARGHFTIRRLERKYDPYTVKNAYAALMAAPA
jgi:hypothetical protein